MRRTQQASRVPTALELTHGDVLFIIYIDLFKIIPNLFFMYMTEVNKLQFQNICLELSRPTPTTEM